MAERSDVYFTFDSSGFINAIRNMKAGMSDFKDYVIEKVKESSYSIDKTFEPIKKKKIVPGLIPTKTDLATKFSVKFFDDIVNKVGILTVKTDQSISNMYDNISKKSKNIFTKFKNILVTEFGYIKGAFKNAFKKEPIVEVKKSFDNLNKTLDTSKKNYKGLGFVITKSLIAFELLKRGVSAIINTVNQAFPELSQSLGFVKNIFFKNLLWPLRRELLPVLQNIVNWAKDNRMTFVRWGSVLVSIFRLVKQIFKTLYTIVKPIMVSITSFIKDIFGISTKSISESINILVFKLTAFMIIFRQKFKVLGVDIKNVFDTILSTMQNFLKSFKEGFIEGFGDIGNLINFKNILSDISNILKGLAPVINFITKNFGEFLGRQIKTAMTTLKLFVTIIKSISDIVKTPAKFMDILDSASKKMARDIGVTMAEGETAPERFTAKTEKIFEKGTTRTERKFDINFGNINIYTKDGILDRQAVKDTANNLKEEIRQVFLDERFSYNGAI